MAFVPKPSRAACVTATVGGAWTNTAMTAQTGTFTATFDATPSASPTNSVVALSDGAQTAYANFSCLARFNTTGDIDARNGGAFAAAAAIPYSAGVAYHFRMVVNVAAQTYSTYVTPAGGSELTVGLNYAFRIAATTLNNWGVSVETAGNGGAGTVTVCNFSTGGTLPQAGTPSFGPAPGTYTSAQSVAITTATSGASIRYTTDGSTPSETAGTLYSVPVNIGATATLQAIAYESGFTDSTIASGTYTITTTPPPAIEINSGGPAVSPFVADEDFTGGATIDHANTIDTSKVTNPAPAAVYQSARVTATAGAGTTFSYTIGGFTAGSSNTVRLHFCETFHTTKASREFNVSINGTQVLTNFDIFATAGGQNIANIQQFTEAANASGQYVILFTTVVDKALISGIEIDSTTTTQPPAAPSFSPAPGSYTSAQSVAISDTTAGASIFYTTDGSTPTTSSTAYTGPISIATTTTLQAIANNSGGNSSVTSGTYSISGSQPAAPIFNPPGGTYASAQSVTITSTGATAIYYTTDGTTPTTASTLYTGPVTIASSTVLKAIGDNSAGTSTVSSAGYTIGVAQGNFSLSVVPTPVPYPSSTVTPSANASYTITVTPSGGFTGNVSLQVSGLPSNTFPIFYPAMIHGGSGTSVLDITTLATTPSGTYSVTITGVSGSLQEMAGTSLVMNTTNCAQEAANIIGKMSLQEKVDQSHGAGNRQIAATANVPLFNFCNGTVGVGGSGSGHGGNATQLPSATCAAATFDTSMAHMYGSIVGKEAVDYSNGMVEGPGMNICRVPECGRTFEYWGEDPFLEGEMGTADIRGIQSQGINAEAKHYLGNNQETNRMTENDVIDERTLHEIYMPHFEKATMPGYGQVDAVMGAYNLVNGTYCCQNSVILNNTLFALWGFDGYTTSDFGAMHSTVPSALAGMTNEEPTGNFYATPLLTAVNNGQVPLATLNDMVSRRLAKMFCRGNFKTPPPNIPIDQTGDGAIAREIAENGAVLLKNTNLTLPLNASTLTSIALIGPYATSAHSSGGGSGHVSPAYTVAPLAGLQNRVGSGVTVTLNDGSNTSTAASLAASSSVAIVMVGDAESEGSDVSISLSGNQDALISAVVAAQPRTIVVLKSSTAVLMPWVSTVPAILDVWYPSEEDGNVVAALLFGDVNPSGKLPITFPVQVSDQPAQVSSSTTINYSEGVLVGYRWYDAKNIAPLFPFGFGLSYTTFSYANLAISPGSFTFSGNPNQTVSVDFDVSNTGAVFGQEAAQVYVGRPPLPGGLTDPPKWLKGFQKVPLSVGENGHAHIVLDFRSFAYWDVKTHAWLVAPGNYSIYVGSSSRDIRLTGQVTIN